MKVVTFHSLRFALHQPSVTRYFCLDHDEPGEVAMGR